MEPQIKYARTDDGVNIAYYTLGSGPPLIWLSAPSTHLLVEWRMPQYRAAIEATSRTFNVVRLDPRGFGLSDRDAPNIGFKAMAEDILAVLKKEALGPAVVLGMALAAYPAVLLAAAHPELVSRLIVMGIAPNLAVDRSPRLDALHGLALTDWDFAADTIIRSFWDLDRPETEALARLLRESVHPQTLFDLVDVTERKCDVSEELKSLQMPTLVIHDLSNGNRTVDSGRKAAALIPQGRLVEVETPWYTPSVVAKFLRETDFAVPTRSPDEMPRHRESTSESAAQAGGTAIILFADIVDSTALTERLGDAAFRDRARDLDTALRSIIRENAGTPIEGKLLGDGVLATFTSARQAIEAALACGASGESAGLPLHLGLHAGDVIREENNVFGGAVNIASRISGLSAPGEVLVSRTVADLARTSAAVSFEDRGEHTLKGVAEPQRVFAVRRA